MILEVISTIEYMTTHNSIGDSKNDKRGICEISVSFQSAPVGFMYRSTAGNGVKFLNSFKFAHVKQWI